MKPYKSLFSESENESILEGDIDSIDEAISAFEGTLLDNLYEYDEDDLMTAKSKLEISMEKLGKIIRNIEDGKYRFEKEIEEDI